MLNTHAPVSAPDPLPPPAKRKKRHKQAQARAQKQPQDAAVSSERARSESTTDDYSINPVYKEPAAATGADRSLQSSRIARLAKLRRHARTSSRGAASPSGPARVEMVTVAHRSASVTSTGRTNVPVWPMTLAEEEQHQPTVAQQPAAARPAAARPVRDWLIGAGIVIVSVVVSASVSASGTDGSFAALNCVRFGSTASAACLHFAAFFWVAIMFQPVEEGGAAVAARHRSIFSKLALALACALAIAAACMGYPRDACDKCTCGACSVYLADTVNETQQECAAVEFGTTEETDVEDRKTCSRGIRALELPKICNRNSSNSLRNATAVISRDLSSSPAELNIFFQVLESFLSAGWGNVAAMPFDKKCSEQAFPACPDDPNLLENWGTHVLALPVQSALCDSVYRYCDAEDQSRAACPDAICCSVCNAAHAYRECEHQAQLDDFTLKYQQTFRPDQVKSLINDTELIEKASKVIIWPAIFLSNATGAEQDWGDCVETCMARSDLPEWYGSHQSCLPNEDRSRQMSRDSTSSSQNKTRDECSCDARALEWKERLLTLRTVAFVGASFLTGVQVLVALFLNGEHVSLCKRPAKELVLTLVVTFGLILGLVQQRQIIAGCEDISAHENVYRMLSWTAMTVFMLGIAMFVGISPVVDWVHGVQEEDESSSSSSRLWKLKNAYDELFSYKKGRFFLLKGVVMEIVEVGTQTNQLLAFSPERPLEWIVGLSVLLILNGIMAPVPFVVQKRFPKFEGATKLLFAMIDAAFDIGCIVITVTYSESLTFTGDAWWTATAGVLVPMAGIALLALDISESAQKTTGSRKVSVKRKSMIAKAVLQRESLITRVMQVASVFMSIFCIVTGSVFLHRALAGDAACRSVLGNTIWEGSSPKLVIVRVNDGSLQGACNFLAIKEISVAHSDRPPMTRLSSELLRLTALETFVLKGQNIASDGVPAAMLDGTSLPSLERLEFGANDPVSKRLNLSARQGGMLNTFPVHALRLMTGLTSLHLKGQNISCFPEVQLLRRLRRLNLSGTGISYLPPSVLFARVAKEDPESEYKLNLDLSGTPVSSFLNWSHHRLAENFDWGRMTTTLPALTSLDLSGNGLTEGRAFRLDELRQLRRLDVSDNPSLFETGFFGWQSLAVLGSHPEYIGLANVGLEQQHVHLDAFTCTELQWMRRVLSNNRVDLGRNPQLERFYAWAAVDRGKFACRCFAEADECLRDDQRELTEGVYFLLLRLLPNIRYLAVEIGIFRNVTREISLMRLVESAREDILWLEFLLSGVEQSTLSCRFQSWADTGKNILNRTVFWNKLVNLERLSLVCIGLSGPISPEIGRLTSLQHLDLRDNQLSGPVPAEIGRLTSLQYLNLGGNQLSGPVPKLPP